MAITEMRLDRDGIFLRLASGQTFSRTREEIRQLVQQQGGRAQALAALRTALSGRLGRVLALAAVTVDFADDGTPLSLEVQAR